MKLRAFASASAIAVIAALSGCASPATPTSPSATPPATQIAVVASTNVWGDLAATVGGDAVKVTSIIDDPAKDPHEYQASAQNQLALAKAQVVIENGGGYDDFVSTMLDSAGNPSVKVLNAVTVSGKSAQQGEELNEHVWYDFPTVMKMIDELEQTYSAVDPSSAGTFKNNSEQLKKSIAGLVAKEADLNKAHSGQPVAITEPVPVYMLDAIGLVNKTPEAFSEAIEEGSDVPPAVLQQTLALFKQHQVKLLAYNEQTSGAETEAVLKAAKESDTPVVPVTETLPDGKNYVSWMTDNLDALGIALAK